MAGTFNSKHFNGEVFQRYIERIPNPRKTELLKSRAIRNRPDLASAMRDEVGGNILSTPLKGLISGSAPMNYDGNTNITPSSTETYMQSRVVVGRSNAWSELDFSYDITGGEDFMENIAEQINDYWNEIDQDTIVSILKGVFSMTGVAGTKFVSTHTSDITGVTNADGKTGVMDATSLNTAMQKASGDQKGKFTLVLMHSVVATGLENLKLLTYLKYTDSDGMEREIGIGTLNGRLVLVDDSMPVDVTETTPGVYKVTVAGTLASGDVITVNGVEVTLDSTSAASATAAATAVVTALGTMDDYTISRSSGVITFTEKTGHVGTGAPSASIESTAGTVAVATTTPAVVNTVYTTYVLGDGAIEFTDCGAKVPYEMDRDPAVKGGQDLLYSRQRKCWAPYGISFKKAYMASASPTDEELADGRNWELVSSAGSTKKYIDPKVIPIARILSLG